jgi:hypothetical protein
MGFEWHYWLIKVVAGAASILGVAVETLGGPASLREFHSGQQQRLKVAIPVRRAW